MNARPLPSKHRKQTFKDSSPTKFYRKGAVGEWPDEYFDETLTRWFKEEAGEALVAGGYERKGDW